MLDIKTLTDLVQKEIDNRKEIRDLDIKRKEQQKIASAELEKVREIEKRISELAAENSGKKWQKVIEGHIDKTVPIKE